ncbi:DUF4013 domain-containing protein [Candidatus Pacearchaeota archaeon]|nr:DUF4013 domain-containing protein [Candidatus Pacearchaeota archaeon]
MVDYLRAIKRPFTDIKKLIIGILLSLPIPLVKIVTNTMALGYTFNCGKSASESNYEMPRWKNHGKLWINAFVAGIIALIYLIPVIIMVFVFAKDLIIDYVTNQTSFLVNFISNPLGLISTYGIGIFFIWALTIIIGYLIPIAMLNWIITEKFSSAFDFGDISKKILNGKYFGAWIVLTIIGTIVGFVTLKFFPLDMLQDTSSIFIGANLIKLIIFLIVISIIEFIQNVFTYTVYGNVLEELKT